MNMNDDPVDCVHWSQMEKGDWIIIDVANDGKKCYGEKPMRLLENPKRDESGVTALVEQDGKTFRQWFFERHKYPVF